MLLSAHCLQQIHHEESMTDFVHKLELTDNEFACLKRIVSEYISDQSTDRSKRSAADGLLLKVQNAGIKDMITSTSSSCWLSSPQSRQSG